MTRIMNVNGKFTDIYSYIKNILFLMVLMTVGAIGAWGQDLSGTYYLAFPGKVDKPSDGYNPSTPTNNYYLCPTENWIYYNGVNSSNKTLITETDNGQPFLTTYKCRNEVYDADKAVWQLIKHTEGTQDYYYVKHCIDGKYLIYNPSQATGGGNRLRAHLERTTSPGTNALFKITEDATYSGYYYFAPYGVNNYWLNLTEGNYPSLVGESGKTDGPTVNGVKYNVNGTLGGWTEANNTSQVYFEEVSVYPPTVTVNADGSVSMTATSGTIYYTTDDSDPKVSVTRIPYSSAVSASDIASATGSAIKAVVINGSDKSVVITLPLASYTYKIVKAVANRTNSSDDIAIQCTVKQAVGTPLIGYDDIPESIRSTYISDETVKFYKFVGDYSTDKLNDENEIKNGKTPGSDATIYVTYTTTQLDSEDKFLHLRGARPFNLQRISDNKYIYYDQAGNTVGYDSPAQQPKDKPHLWYFAGGDPYAVVIRNAEKNGESYKYLTYSSSDFSLSDTPVSYILMGTTAEGRATLTDGTTEFKVDATSVDIPLQYALIDQDGRIIKDDIDSPAGVSVLELPVDWQSPLVSKYHYYKYADFTVTSDAKGDKYTLTDPQQDELDEITDVPDNPKKVYVTYDVNDQFSFDTNTADERDAAITTYMLHFNTGDHFYQEASDKLMGTKTQAAYPYANGDGCLYVYGTQQWSDQSTSGMSTRTRWLWYVVSTNGKPDPYHVRIKSYQQQASTSFNYFRTYPVSYTEYKIENGVITSQEKIAVVTGVTTRRSEVDDEHDNELPTEYMVLKGPNGDCILKTFNPIEVDLNNDGDKTDDGENVRHVVTSFEQYWKTYETISDNGEKNYAPPINNPMFTEKDITLNYYQAYAYARPITTSEPTQKNSKEYSRDNHWFQTINMGTTGEFKFEPVALEPQVILLDQHGWEILRKPLPKNANDTERINALRIFDSPMVDTYYWYPEADKVPNYHKYRLDDLNPEIKIYRQNGSKWEWKEGDPTYTYTSKTLAADPYADHPDQPASVKGDFYVTYTVKSEYANRYTATSSGKTVSPVILKQNGQYAYINGTSLATTDEIGDLEDVAQQKRRNMQPNADIDEQMGYKYDVEEVEKDEEGNVTASHVPNKEETEADYFTNGQNGFDPYNVQIQNAATPTRYFTTNATASTLVNGAWTGTYPTAGATISLQNMAKRYTAVGNDDQVKVYVTNATFMVVGSSTDNMLLMPRFDHTRVMQSFATLEVPSGATEQALTATRVAKKVSSTDEMTDMGGYYILNSGFSLNNSIGTKDQPFLGIIDGKLHTLSGLNTPLVAYAEDATIRNVILDNVNITSGYTIPTEGSTTEAVGAIAANASGSTRIYNCGILATNTIYDDEGNISVCGSKIGGNGYVGGLVGFLGDYSRVINCYSYAEITRGDKVAGIVGYNDYSTSSTKTSTDTQIRTMVMNCIFYGNITGGNDKAPVYNGYIISNSGSTAVGNYNYFRSEAPWAQNSDNINTPNCALMAEDRFLQRFEFFRHLLNSHRELAGWWATDTYSKDEMVKWVLEPSQIGSTTPFPILKEPGYYPSVVNLDTDNLEEFSKNDAETKQAERNQGRKFGTLAVTIQMDDANDNKVLYHHPDGASLNETSLTLPITDKDPEHFDFNYYKVQLPYYNDYGTKNYNGNRVVTGWKIVSITGGTEGSYTTGDDATATVNTGTGEVTLTTPYNFADRHCTKKDLYSVSKRVFNQGAYWDVPEGVTAITIEPYWARCVYLADQNADKVYDTEMNSGTDVPNIGGGQIFTNGNSYSIAGESQVVYTSMSNAIASSGTALFSGVDANNHTVYDYAVVLVGNYHHIAAMEASNSKPYTVTSVDLDGDNEPDYSYILRFNGRTPIHPVRVDFINIPGLGMAQKSTGGKGSYNFGILQPKNFFESTNTSLFRVTQFEYDAGRDVTKPYIVQGGVFEQWVGGQQTAHKNKITYFHVGGNVWFKEFHRGCHQDKQHTTKHPPVSVTGGDYDEFYLTGLYRGDVNNYEDNAECYINGGRFGIVAGAAMEGIGKANGANNTGNIIWQIQNADIDEFYAGGINAAKPVQGNLTTAIEGGYIKLFYGGPKFGDMNTGKTVTTTATGCIFDKFFGAGYGGNSYSRYAPTNQSSVTNIKWNDWVKKEYKQEYNSTYGGVSTQIGYQFLPMSDNKTNVARLFVEFVKFSLATTRNVHSKLTGCIINDNFYGGGSLGKVAGNVTSVLDDCTVKGNVFGAGFSAQQPTVIVDSKKGFEVEPYYYDKFGTYRTGVKYKEDDTYKPITYTWEHATTVNTTATAIKTSETEHILYTTEDLSKSNLGSVEGSVSLTIQGKSIIGTDGDDNTGNVYGGGDESYVTGEENKVTVTLKGKTQVKGNVYGGGNQGAVYGSTEVNIID